MSDEELCKALRSALWGQGHHINIKAADRIEQLERENARLDAGWSDANFRALDAGLKLAKTVEALRLADKVNLMPPIVAKTIHAVLAELEGKE